MSLCTEFAWGGFAGYKPEWPQPNRSRVLLCAACMCVCLCARVCACVSARKHIPELSISGWSRSRDFDQQTSFVSTSSPIETTFLVWNFHFSLIPPSFCFYFFSILALWSFFFFTGMPLFFSFLPFFPFLYSDLSPVSFFPTIFLPLLLLLVPFPSLSPPLLSDFLTGRSSCQAHTGAQAPISLYLLMALTPMCLHCNTWSWVKKKKQRWTFIAGLLPLTSFTH